MSYLLPSEFVTKISPYKQWAFAVPQDPLIYRLYEIVGVYGKSIKESFMRNSAMAS